MTLAQCSGFFEAGTSEQWSRAQQQQQLQSHAQGQELPRIGENEADDEEQTPGGAPTLLSSGGSIITAVSRHTPMERPRMRWHYELDWGGTEADDTPMLVQKAAAPTLFGGDSQSSRPSAPSSQHHPMSQVSRSDFFRSLSGNRSAMHIARPPHPPPNQESFDDSFSDVLRDYDNLFRIFYNYPPTLDTLNIANAYIECKTLLNLADMYDALKVVGPRIEHHLLRFRGRLWKQIAKYPPSYLKLGFLARSEVIFAEALVHVVGQWPQGANHLRRQLPDGVLDVIEDKVDELEESKSEIERQLFHLTLSTSRGQRVTPSNAYQDWMAVCLFRQWLAENTTPPTPAQKDSPRIRANGTSQMPPPSPAATPLNTGRIYRLLGTAGQAYLGHEEVKRFLKLRPDDYSRETVRRFERKLEDLKHMARETVRPLMSNFLELDLGRDGGSIGYLTCTKVEGRDFPWEE